jgi:hypothetical protein
VTTAILVLVIAAFYGIATSIDSRRNANRVIAAVFAERACQVCERETRLNAGIAAFDSRGKSANR